MTHLRWLILGSGFLLALVVGVYWPVAHYSFLNFDDNLYVTQNSFVSSGLSWKNVRWAFTQAQSGHWQPVTWLSHMLDCQLFGLRPGAHHLVNVLLHGINASLLFLFLGLATRALGPAFFTAALFAVHPMRLESVAWIAERKDVLSVCFGMLSLLAYRRYALRPSVQRYGAAWGLWALSLLSKPTLITFPALLLLIDYWPLARLSRRNLTFLIREKLPLVATSILFAAVAIYAQRAGGGYRSLGEFPLADRMAWGSLGYLTYFGKLLWPTGFGVFYPKTALPPGVGVAAFLGCLGVGAWAIHFARKHRAVAMGTGWFLVSLVPMIGFIPIGGQAFADRWTYVPHVGLLVAGVWLVKEKVGVWPALVALALCIGTTRTQLPHWRDSVALFQHTLTVSPQNLIAHTNLGTALNALGRHDEAATHFAEAIRINPEYPEALNNLGIYRAQSGDIPEARSLFLRAALRRPDFPEAHYNLGLAEDSLGNHLVAVDEWVTTLQLRPGDSAASRSLATVLRRHFSEGCNVWKENLTEPDRHIARKLSSAVQASRALALPGGLTEMATCLN